MKRLLKTIFIALGGALLGYIIGSIFAPGDIRNYVILFMGFPFGWSFLARYAPSLLSTNLVLMVAVFVLRIFLAGIIGWFIIPVELILSVVEVFTDSGD